MELKTHLRQSLVHMLDVRGRVLNQTLALAHVGSQLRNLSLGGKLARNSPNERSRCSHCASVTSGCREHRHHFCLKTYRSTGPAGDGRAHPLRWEAGSFSVRYAVDGLNDALAAATGGLSI